MSLTGALLAVFVQQWAQSYLRATQARLTPRKRARLRSFHAEGIERLHFAGVTRAVPTLIHVSLFLFFSGLTIFLFNIHHTVFNIVLIWLGLCVVGYAFITLMPIFCQDSPYYSPLTSSVWFCVTRVLFDINWLLQTLSPLAPLVFQWYNARYSRSRLWFRSLRGMQAATARQLSSDIDYRALVRMFVTSSDDGEFEQFFDALPGFCYTKDSNVVFIKQNEKMFSRALIELMDRTLLSNLIPEAVKLRRIIICTMTVDATSLLGPWWILRRVLILGAWHKFLGCIEFGLFVKHWRNIAHPVTRFYAECVAAVTISSVPAQEGDDRWFQLASGPLGTSKNLYQNYVKNKDSILLANAISILRRTVQTYSGSAERHRKDVLVASSKALESLRKLDPTLTSPDIQHEFCGVWNQLVDRAQNDDCDYVVCVAKAALKNIRKLYIGLHKGTAASPTGFSDTTDDGDAILDDARTYCKCNLDEHRPPQPFPDLQIEAAPDPSPIPFAPGIPTPPFGAVHSAMGFLSHSSHPHTSAQVPSSPAINPTSNIPRSPATLSVAQLASLSPLTARTSNEGAASASAINSALSSSGSPV
jgi:hypothetical protein